MEENWSQKSWALAALRLRGLPGKRPCQAPFLLWASVSPTLASVGGAGDAKTLVVPLRSPSQVNVSVHNRLVLRNSSNVLGIIRGAVEPGERLLPAPEPPGRRPPPSAPAPLTVTGSSSCCSVSLKLAMRKPRQALQSRRSRAAAL